MMLWRIEGTDTYVNIPYTMLKKNKIFLEDIAPLIYYVQEYTYKIVVTVSHTEVLNFSNVLKKHANYLFDLLSCISGVDLMESDYRYSVVYDLLSIKYNARVRLKVFLNELAELDSLSSVFINSDWWEREIWDMYGIHFINHPDLRRILTDYGFEGHPMRKDFPLSGYVESAYDESTKKVEPFDLKLVQEMRNFQFSKVYATNNTI
jgi:NADH dehydrogenase (ubiquinone) Fe-S protein 3